MSESSRTSALASRHTELGSGLEDWNDMGSPWSYTTNANDEHDAVREAAGLFDMSPLKRVFVRGADALQVVDDCMSRDMTRVKEGFSAYASILSDRGTVLDDAIAANCGNNEWFFCHGSGDSLTCLEDSAQGLNADIEVNDDLHNISLQGPKALDLLNAHTPIDLSSLAYFGHTRAKLFGHPCRISRTGYSGERGYEITLGANSVCDVWDQILGEGKDHGVMACSYDALDKIRVEAGLLFYGYDMTDAETPWEVGLGFTVNIKNSQYRGKDAVMASKGQERFTLAGLSFDHSDALAGGEILTTDGTEVGLVNSPVWSHRLNKSIALGRVQTSHNIIGAELACSSDGFTGTAKIENIPFYDPQKTNTHA